MYLLTSDIQKSNQNFVFINYYNLFFFFMLVVCTYEYHCRYLFKKCYAKNEIYFQYIYNTKQGEMFYSIQNTPILICIWLLYLDDGSGGFPAT